MIPIEKKRDFVKLRAERKSLRKICVELGLSYASAIKLDKELASEVHNVSELLRDDLRQYCYEARMSSLQVMSEIRTELQKAIRGKMEAVPSLNIKELLQFYPKYDQPLQTEGVDEELNFLELPPSGAEGSTGVLDITPDKS